MDAVQNSSLFRHIGITDEHFGRLQPIFQSPVSQFVSSLSIWQGLAVFLCLFWGYSSLQLHRRVRVPGAPVHGYFSWLEPSWVLQLRYAKDAYKIIESGYLKVSQIVQEPIIKSASNLMYLIHSTPSMESPSSFVARILTLRFFQLNTSPNCAPFPIKSLAGARQISWLVMMQWERIRNRGY